MKEQTNLVPKRRFKEFQNTYAWEQRKLGDMGKTYTGLSGKTKEDFGHGSAEFVTYMNVFSNSISDTSMTENVEVDSKQNELEYGDVLFTTSSETPQEVGMSSVWLGNRPNVYLNSFCFGYRPTVNVNYLFLAYMLRSNDVRKQMMLLAQGISRYNISKNKVMELQVGLPNIQEQEKIGNFFKQLDHTISLHQRKLEKTKALKSAYLAEMFPAEGECEPKRRFAGFTQIWEQRKLGELCQIGDIDHKMPKSVKDGVPYIMTGDFFGINDIDFKNSKLISPEDYEQLAKKIKPEAGDILFARYASVGTVRYVETQIKFLVSYSCAILKHNDIANGKYLFYYLQANEAQRQIELEVNTGSQRNIGIDSLKKLIILLPQEKEQEKVATFFAKLDNLITLHQRKLEKLQKIKKAYLNEMFV